MSETVEMIHPDGTRVSLHLPAPAGTVGILFVALDGLGFTFEHGSVSNMESEISMDPERQEEINEQLRNHVQPLVDAFRPDEKVRRRYRDGQ